MIRIMMLAALAAAVLAPAIARAQPANAIGEPLPESTMAQGTLTVRVVAGVASAAVTNAEVTLTVDGKPRTAKTDGSGRALFTDIPAGAQVQATITGEDKQPVASSTFPMAKTGGMRVMLSTKPFSGMPASHGATAGAAQGAPEARAMSGQPRGDQQVAPGVYQIRLTYNSLVVGSGKPPFDPSPPVGEAVTLVGYRSDDTVEVLTQPVGQDGVATFEQLDISGNTSYYALARLPRNKVYDRLVGAPMEPPTQVGAKLVLSGDKRDSAAPAIDDLLASEVPPGKVLVAIEGADDATVVLVDATTKSVIAEAKTAIGPPDASDVTGQAPFTAAADLPAGALAIRIHGGVEGTDANLADIPIRVIPADKPNAEGLSAKTAADGTAQLQIPAGPHKAVFNVNGADLVSSPFDLSKTGGRFDVEVSWPSKGKPVAAFDVPYQPGLVLYAESRGSSARVAGAPSVFRSRPFQLVPTAGALTSIRFYPRVLVSVSMTGGVEDELLHIRAQYVIQNLAWAPYRAGPDGMVIPLPAGFKGGQVAEEQQHIASIAPGEGVRIVRPLRPGQTAFVAGYSLLSSGGNLTWNLDVTTFMVNSSLILKLTDGMKVRPKGAAGREGVGRDGSPLFVLDPINIDAGRSMTMEITGMPSPPAWREWLPRIVLVIVLVLIIGGVVLALNRKALPVAPGTDARRTALLDELVELERSGKDPVRREQVVTELERLWRE